MIRDGIGVNEEYIVIKDDGLNEEWWCLNKTRLLWWEEKGSVQFGLDNKRGHNSKVVSFDCDEHDKIVLL